MKAHRIGTVRKIEARLRAYDGAIKSGSGRRVERPFTLEGMAAQEIEGLRDEVARLRRM